MKTYLILTRSITGLSGNPRYVNNKCKLLKEAGWNPIVVWNYNSGNIELEHVKPFKQNVLHELQFFPCWYSKIVQESILKKIINIIDCNDELIIESNKLQLAAWGELLAKRCNAKHIIFITSEGIKLENRSSFDFFYRKLLKKELFTINEGSVQKLFQKFITIKEPEKYCWAAAPGVEVQEKTFPQFDQMPPSDYVISHFGRYKPYFKEMVNEIKSFITQNPSYSFNLFFLGDVSKSECDLVQIFTGVRNVNVFVHPPMSIIPQIFFKKSHLVIATAGCASIAWQNKSKVISMDVQTHKPLGLLGYTTLDTNVDSKRFDNKFSLSEWLEKILIEKISFRELSNIPRKQYFDSQIKYFTPSDGVYINSEDVEEKITQNDKLLKYISKIGFYKLVNFLFYYKRGIK